MHVIFKTFGECGFSTHAPEIMPTFLWLMYHICVESYIFPETFSKSYGFSLPKLQLSYVSNCLSIHCRNEEPVWAFLRDKHFKEKRQWEEMCEHSIVSVFPPLSFCHFESLKKHWITDFLTKVSGLVIVLLLSLGRNQPPQKRDGKSVLNGVFKVGKCPHPLVWK